MTRKPTAPSTPPPTVDVAAGGDRAAALLELLAGEEDLHLAGAWPAPDDLPATTLAAGGVLLLDLAAAGAASPASRVRAWRDRLPAARLLVVVPAAAPERAVAAIAAGADGVVESERAPEALAGAVRDLASGGTPLAPAVARRLVELARRPPAAEAPELSPRQAEVVALLAAGHSYKTAARVLGLSVDGVRYHLRNAYRRLGVHTKSEAVARVLSRGSPG